MPANAENDSRLLKKAAEGDQAALGEVFNRHCDRLKRLVRLRMHRTLRGTIDETQALEQIWREAARRVPEYGHQNHPSVFLWLRQVAVRTLVEIHRQRLGEQAGFDARDVCLHHGALPVANSATLAAQLMGKLPGPWPDAEKAESRLLVQEVLNSMHPLDRELLALRHFEQLTLSETAAVLGLSIGATGRQYLQALKQLRSLLSKCSGFEHL